MTLVEFRARHVPSCWLEVFDAVFVARMSIDDAAAVLEHTHYGVCRTVERIVRHTAGVGCMAVVTRWERLLETDRVLAALYTQSVPLGQRATTSSPHGRQPQP